MPKASKSKVKSPPSGYKPDRQATEVSWPIISPLSPHRALPEITTIIPSQILTLPLFSKAESQQYLSFLQKVVTPLLETTPAKPKKGNAARVNDRFQIIDADFARMLWENSALKPALEAYSEVGKTSKEIWGGTIVGLNPNIRVYRYLKGHFFDKHYDDYNMVEMDIDTVKVQCRTTYTLLIYLTSSPPIVGGETVFFTESSTSGPGQEFVVSPSEGTALLHAHGSECLLHEGRQVTDDAGGVGKWILRSDLVIRP